ncbi:MAG: phosphate ABC transporter permease PstA [Thermodesulfobacteriota bacterium]|nr:phosphate ABC transporter permease PstA [Thermodesulfobacteriota bacterium]
MKMRLLEIALPLFSKICAAILLLGIGGVVGFLLVNGYQSLDLQLIFGTTPPLSAILLKRQVFDGLLPAIIGTFTLILLSVCWAIPIGIAAGIYLAEYAHGKNRQILEFLFDVLAGLPSIVVGLCGFVITVLLNRALPGQIYPCLLISSVTLAFLVLPYIIRTTQTALTGLPHPLRQTALAFGASKLQNTIRILLPQALPGIISGIILAIGRCAEDTAVIMLTGVVAAAGIPGSLLSNYEALPFYIYYTASQYADQKELATAYGAAIILLTICMLLFSLAVITKKHINQCYRA